SDVGIVASVRVPEPREQVVLPPERYPLDVDRVDEGMRLARTAPVVSRHQPVLAGERGEEREVTLPRGRAVVVADDVGGEAVMVDADGLELRRAPLVELLLPRPAAERLEQYELLALLGGLGENGLDRLPGHGLEQRDVGDALGAREAGILRD